MTNEEAMHRADPDQGAALDQLRLNLDQSHVAMLGDQLPNEGNPPAGPALSGR